MNFTCLKKAAEVAPGENGRIRYHQKLERLAAGLQVPPDLREP